MAYRLKLFISLASIGLGIGLLGLVLSEHSARLRIHNHQISVTIADEPQERQLGLSGRDSLARDEGMLFVFTESGEHGFWMKDMRFGLDIIWINERKQIVDIAANVLPQTYPKTFYPAASARYVLEVNAGVSRDNNIEIGDQVDF